MKEHPYEDHFVPTYSEVERATIEDVLAFNREFAAAFEDGRDVREVVKLLDPDPLRYMWVDEGEGEIQPDLARARKLLARAPSIAGHRRLDSKILEFTGDASAPSVAVSGDGGVLLGWVDWADGIGEQVKAARLDINGEAAVPPSVLSGRPADCFRPTVTFDSDGKGWIFYGRSEGEAAQVCAHRLEGDQWSDPITISSGGPAFNQEVAALSSGGLACCWQQWIGRRFAILARTYSSGEWSNPLVISEDSDENVWDPCLAPMPNGGLAYAWSSYREGAYKVVVRVAHHGRLGPARLVSEGTDYALHPTLACTTSGELWCAFDRVTVQGHGGSGTTKLRSLENVSEAHPIDGVLQDGRHFPRDLVPDLKATVELVRLEENGVRAVSGVGDGLEIVPAGLPRLAATPDGGLVIAYRIVRRMAVLAYYWELAVQVLGANGLSGPMTFENSDGNAEEPDVAGGPNGAIVVWQRDGRRQRALSWTEGFGGKECLHLKHHYGHIVWHGIHDSGAIAFGSVSTAGPAAEPKSSLTVVAASTIRQEARPWLATRDDRYQTSVGNSTYSLYWGDLHRHSLISRCTAADEPSLDDYYRYSRDVFGYDFWALTDHAENSTARHWWCIQKSADLFRVKDEFAPLYGFEWTSWSGHQNVIYGLCRRGAPIMSAYAEGSDTPDKLWALLRAHPEFPAVTIPHHPGSAMVPFDWNYFDPEYVRLVEIFQACRGNYEQEGCFRQYADATLPGTFVADALRRNYRFGLIASSDHGFGASYVGAFAPTLDRASVFDALHARRTLAATTRGIVIDFRIGDTFMGGETVLAGPVPIEIYVRGYREISRIEIVRDGETVHAVAPDPTLLPGWVIAPVRVEWGMGTATTDWSGCVQVDRGEILQSEFWAPEVVSVTRERVDWRAVTVNYGEMYGSQRGGVELSVIGPPDAVVSVNTKVGSLKVTLGELAARRAVEVTGNAGGRIRLQPGTGALMGLGCEERKVNWVDESGLAAWYYVRALLVDGEMAWSSPIWVDRA